MSFEQRTLDYQLEINENQRQMRQLVMGSYHDIDEGKSKYYNNFFEDFEKNVKNV